MGDSWEQWIGLSTLNAGHFYGLTPQKERRSKKIFQQKFGRKSTGRKYNFKPAPLLHFHSTADSARPFRSF
jgi:hypothetical protein